MTTTRHSPTNIRAAYFARAETVLPGEAVGRISAECRRRYPPGVPTLAFGDVVSEDQLARSGNPGALRVVARDAVQIDACRSQDFTPAQVDALADLFRETFSNAPYDQYAWCERTSDVLGFAHAHGEAERYRTLDELDRAVLPRGIERFMDPTVTRRVFARRLEDDGIVSRARCADSGALLGAVHLRKATLGRLFETEDWQTPTQWMAGSVRGPRASRAAFMQRMRDHFDLSARSAVVTVSAQMVRPEARGGRVMAALMRKAAAYVPASWAHLPLISESKAGTPAHVLNSAVHERCVHGVLEHGHALLFCNRLASALWYFEWPDARYRSALRRIATVHTTGVAPHADDHPGVAVRVTEDGRGHGVFATQNITKGEVVARFVGERYRSESASMVPAVMRDHCIQVGPRDYIHAENRLAEHLNHSCEPNCGIAGRDTLFAARDIAVGEELVWDYRCSEDSDWVLDDCRCGTESCTGTIAGWSSLSADRKTRYRDAGLVSDWLAERAQPFSNVSTGDPLRRK